MTENNLVMKQQRSTYTAVGTETSKRADEKLPLGSSTVNSIRPSCKELLTFIESTRTYISTKADISPYGIKTN